MSRFVKCLCVPLFAFAFLAVADTSSAQAEGVAVEVNGVGFTTFTYKPSLLSVPVQRVVTYPWSYRVGRVAYLPSPTPVRYYVPPVVPRVSYYGWVPRYPVFRAW